MLDMLIVVKEDEVDLSTPTHTNQVNRQLNIHPLLLEFPPPNSGSFESTQPYIKLGKPFQGLNESPRHSISSPFVIGWRTALIG